MEDLILNNEHTIIENDTSTDNSEYYYDVFEHFNNIPDVAKPLLTNAKKTLGKIKEMLYSSTSFFNAVKSSIPEETFQAILSPEQKAQIARGTLELMTKKDGNLMANLVDPNTKKIVSTIPLKRVKVSPEMSQAMTNYSTQMQMAQIAEQIQLVQIAVEEVRQGQEFDRLASAYSCQQKLLQAMKIKNTELRNTALLRIALDAEDSRNLLMQSQGANIAFIEKEPENILGKLLSGSNSEKIGNRMNEIRESLTAVNMVSLVEAMAYQEMGETEAALQSLNYYADYINKMYLSKEGLVTRLDLIDSSPENYWSNTLPKIEEKIMKLSSSDEERLLIGEE